jgi:hypothetical protein
MEVCLFRLVTVSFIHALSLIGDVNVEFRKSDVFVGGHFIGEDQYLRLDMVLFISGFEPSWY